MKKLRGSTLAKVLAIFLLVVSILSFAASVLGALLMVQLGFYTDGWSSQRVLEDMGYSHLYRTADYLTGVLEETNFAPDTEELDFWRRDFYYRLQDENGKILFDNFEGGDTLWSVSLVLNCQPHIGVEYDEKGNAQEVYYENSWVWGYLHEGDTVGGAYRGRASSYSYYTPKSGEEEEKALEREYTLTGFIPSELSENGETARLVELAIWAYSLRYTAIGIAVGSLLLAIALFIFLLCAAGHRDGTETVTPNFSDKIPFDLFTAALGTGFMCLVMLGIEALREVNIDDAEGIFLLLVSVGLFVAAGILLIWFCMSFATRLKLGTVIKSCLCYKILAWAWRTFKAILRWWWRANKAFFRLLRKFFRSISLLKKTILILAAVLTVEFFWLCLFQWDLGAQLFGWFVERAVLVLLILYVVLCMRRLQKGAREIARGNETYVIDTKYMHGDLKGHAEDLNSIRDGMVRAVNERMKSERFKTELITNVSHDIKTPLTSIINYVDLLGKEEPENEKMREYIDVLSRQSARLKKLIEDLIEASKASTGNLSVNMERCDLGVLLDQTTGEYAEKLAAAKLELVTKKPEQPVTVMADGRHTWRIFDNLMNNVCKYAQPGTRVYLNLEQQGSRATVTFRNISRSQLNISGDELMERFVRGDSSRNTEGSGLGLSIARSLAQLQNSDLDLTVDGDLFKVTLGFNTAV